MSVLSDHFYRRNLDDCGDVNPDNDDLRLILSVYETINPDNLGDGEANRLYLGKEGQYSDKGPDVRGLGPEWDGDTYKEVIYIERDTIVISEADDVLDYLSLSKTVDWRVAVLILAASGVDIVLPPLIFERMNEELAAELRKRLAHERLDYLAAITELGGAAVKRISKKDYKEIKAWASDIVGTTIWPLAVKYDSAMSKQRKSLREEVRYKPLVKRIPSIGAKLIRGDFTGAGLEFFNTTVREISDAMNRRNAPTTPKADELLWYQLKIAEEVNAIQKEMKGHSEQPFRRNIPK